MASEERPLVKVADVRKVLPVKGHTGSASLKAVDGVSMTIWQGETFGLVGESGGGKSTLGRIVAGLVDPTSGSVHFDGRHLEALPPAEMRKFRRRIQIVFQDPYSSLNPRMRVRDIVGEPLAIHRLLPRSERTSRVEELLRLTGLDPSLANRYPAEFSGGQRQRIGIARALAVEPEFIVLDEPISALDVSIQAQILNLLLKLREQLNLTYLFIAHDLSAVRHLADRVGVMYLGSLVEVGRADSVYKNPSHPYTRALFSAVPVPVPEIEQKRQRIILNGDLSSALDPPPGCKFHPRCPLYETLGRPEICRTEKVSLVETAVDHHSACHFSDISATAALRKS